MIDPPQLLIVDDSRFNLMILQDQLTGPDRIVVTAETGEEALALCAEQRFALVLLDVVLPGLDGFEVAARLRAAPATRSLPILFMTGLERGDAQIARGYELGAVDYLFKPVDEAALRSKVDVFLQLARQRARLAAQQRELARSNRELAMFAAAAAHDLRQPLRSMLGALALLKRRHGEELSDGARGFVDRATGAGRRMTSLIDDLLHYARLGTAPPALEMTSLADAVRDALANLDEAIADCGAQIEVGPLPPVHAHPTLLVQLLQNLVSNALKFRREGVVPRVGIEAEAQPGLVRLRLRDNGIGIAEADQERIFGSFVRLHGRSRYEGHGLGLALCARIVQLHGGRIGVHSEPGAGSTFWLELGG